MKIPLDELIPGQCAVISNILSSDGLKRRMTGMGLRTGRQIAVIRRARMGGPIQVRVGSTDLMIRRIDARLIEVTHCDISA